MKIEIISMVIVSLLFLAPIAWTFTAVLAARGLSVMGNPFKSIHNTSVDGWAVLLEMNEFPEGWSDLPVGFINSERMQATLFSLGWQIDGICTIQDNITISIVQEAVKWLDNNTDYNDIALLYIFTHGMWMRNVLLWNEWFPAEWKKLDISAKILMIDTCHAEEFINPVRNDQTPHISLGCCSADEVSWAGLEEEGLPIIGSVWNYYFTNALCNSSADFEGNGFVSIEEAFNFSKPLVQQYMNETVFAVPEFLNSYHDIGIYPENYDAYPHPVMDDWYPNQLTIQEFQSPDITPPTISIVSPENKTYKTSPILLDFSIDGDFSWIGFSLDGQANAAIVGSTILSNLSYGLHNLIVYAKDEAGNLIASEMVYFTIETPSSPPSSFPTWTAIAIVMTIVTGTAVLVYSAKVKKMHVHKVGYVNSLNGDERTGFCLVI